MKFQKKCLTKMRPPEVGAVTWVSSFNSVDLPAPFEPMMPTASPLLTVKLTPFSAINVVPIRRWSVPMRVFGSSLPRLRAHQLCIAEALPMTAPMESSLLIRY